MESGSKIVGLGQNVEKDEIDDGVGTTDLVDERMICPKSTSNSNENVF